LCHGPRRSITNKLGRHLTDPYYFLYSAFGFAFVMGSLEAAKIPPKESLRSNDRSPSFPKSPLPSHLSILHSAEPARRHYLNVIQLRGYFRVPCAFNSTARRNRSTGANESKMLIMFKNIFFFLFLNLQLRFPWVFFRFRSNPSGVVKRNGCQFGRQVAPRDDTPVRSSARFKNRKTHRWIRPSRQMVQKHTPGKLANEKNNTLE
jgi:hypothetical protein